MDTRIGVNLFHFLKLNGQADLGYKVLMSVAERNPYNPRPFRLLARAPVDQAMAAVDLFKRSIASDTADNDQGKDRCG